MAHLTHTLFVHASVDTIDAIVGNPRRWPEFWVGMSEPDKVFGSGSPGTKTEFTQLMMGVRLRVINRTVEERHNPDGSTDWRWELEGTTTGSLSCHHAPRDNGSELTTTFDYTIPGSVLGRFADRLFIEKRFRRDFEDSLENLKLLAETSASMPAAASA